jgi:hypothetical protein
MSEGFPTSEIQKEHFAGFDEKDLVVAQLFYHGASFSSSRRHRDRGGSVEPAGRASAMVLSWRGIYPRSLRWVAAPMLNGHETVLPSLPSEPSHCVCCRYRRSRANSGAVRPDPPFFPRNAPALGGNAHPFEKDVQGPVFPGRFFQLGPGLLLPAFDRSIVPLVGSLRRLLETPNSAQESPTWTPLFETPYCRVPAFEYTAKEAA